MMITNKNLIRCSFVLM